jgi:arylsulfatase
MTYRHPSGEEFGGVIGRTFNESKPWWPAPKLPQGSPNVVLVVLDDAGFSHFGCYGSTIETPHIDQLAADGLRFTGFHTTALCSPSRACLLTGRNHHSVGMRSISNMDTGFPNMRGALPRSAATLAEILRDNGYATFATGKWHLAPMAECTAAGPFHNWPLQRGFDRYYGFLQGETDQFHPELTYDNHFVDPPGAAKDGYHVSADIVDRSIGFIRDTTSLVPERPFFLYLAFGATHSPHQSPRDYLDKYRGCFGAGWDAAREEWFARQKRLGIIPAGTRLAPHNPGVRPWAELSEKERLFAARLQEAFAAMLDHTDHQIGRLVGFLNELELLQSTLLIVMSDNGASQEGGPLGVLDEMRYFNGMREDIDAAVGRLDRRSARPLQHPMGLGAGGQHSPQMVQAEYARRRRTRPADYPLARKDRYARPDSPTVLPRHRSRTHHSRSAAHRIAAGGSGRATDADTRNQFGPGADRCKCGRRGPIDAVLRDARSSGIMAQRLEGSHSPSNGYFIRR